MIWPALRRMVRRAAHALRPHAFDSEAAREMAAHIALLEDDARRRGLSADEAAREARLRMGGLAQAAELHRDARGLRWIADLKRDLQYAWRMVWRAPGFSLIAILSIAFGTGANVAMFSAADALLLRPLAVANPNRLLVAGARMKFGLANRLAMSYPDYRDLGARMTAFSALAAFDSLPLAYTPSASAAPRVKPITFVSSNFFDVLGVPPILGRTFAEAEESGPPARVAVLSYGVWQADYGADPSIVGRSVHIGGSVFQVVGVAPESFMGVEIRYVRDSVFVPLSAMRMFSLRDDLADRSARTLSVRGRLAPTASPRDAAAEIEAIGRSLAAVYPSTNDHQAFAVESELQYRYEQAPLDVGLVLLLAVLAGAVLAVACANVAGLLTSRAPVRAREIALRLSIGASRTQLVRQLLVESSLLALAGVAGGLAVGAAGIRLMRQVKYPTEVFALPPMQLDRRALVFSLVLAVITALVSGLWPALAATRVDLASAIKTRDAVVSRRRGVRIGLRDALVALQVALSLVLLTIGAFAFDVFNRGLTDGPGFRTTHMAKVSVDAGQLAASPQALDAFVDRTLAAVQQLAGVDRAAAISNMQLFSFRLVPFEREGAVRPPGAEPPRVFSYDISNAYFATMDIPLLAGRAFDRRDTPASARVVIVNDALAAREWPGQSALGRRVHVDRADGPFAEVVGVVATSKVGYFTEPPTPAIYYPIRQHLPAGLTIVAATSGASDAIVGPLRDVVSRVDPRAPTYDAQSMEVYYHARVTSIGRIVVSMISGMAAMGLTLTVIGLYGLVAYSVNRRTREMGIRIAVGATYARIVRMVVSEGMLPAWLGVAGGIVASMVATRVLVEMVFPLEEPFHLSRIVEAVPVLILVAMAAAFLPARRAARISPVEALRTD